jgi:hypothetical protein
MRRRRPGGDRRRGGAPLARAQRRSSVEASFDAAICRELLLTKNYRWEEGAVSAGRPEGRTTEAGPPVPAPAAAPQAPA